MPGNNSEILTKMCNCNPDLVYHDYKADKKLHNVQITVTLTVKNFQLFTVSLKYFSIIQASFYFSALKAAAE